MKQLTETGLLPEHGFQEQPGEFWELQSVIDVVLRSSSNIPFRIYCLVFFVIRVSVPMLQIVFYVIHAVLRSTPDFTWREVTV